MDTDVHTFVGAYCATRIVSAKTSKRYGIMKNAKWHHKKIGKFTFRWRITSGYWSDFFIVGVEWQRKDGWLQDVKISKYGIKIQKLPF